MQKLIDQTIGALGIREAFVHLPVAGAGRQIEALVLVVSAGERAADEVPGQAEHPHPLFCRHVTGPAQIMVDQAL